MLKMTVYFVCLNSNSLPRADLPHYCGNWGHKSNIKYSGISCHETEAAGKLSYRTWGANKSTKVKVLERIPPPQIGVTMPQLIYSVKPHDETLRKMLRLLPANSIVGAPQPRYFLYFLLLKSPSGIWSIICTSPTKVIFVCIDLHSFPF